MIERLRKRFIRIATLAVAGVLLLLCVTVNAANYVSVDRQLTQMLRMICDNQGTVPHFPPDGGKPGQKPDGPFTPETPYSTRYFVLRYDGDGDLEQADLTHTLVTGERHPSVRHGYILSANPAYLEGKRLFKSEVTRCCKSECHISMILSRKQRLM